MLVQQLQRPTRLLALLTSVFLVYLCFRYLRHVDFDSSCASLRLSDLRSGDRTYDGEFGKTRMLSSRPAMVPKGPLARVAKVGVAVNALDIPVVHRAFGTHQKHNEMHGYPHYIADREVVSDLTDHDRFHRGSGAYTKPAYLLAIIIEELLKPESERLEWIFWFDGDTMVLNPSTPLETFLPPNTSAILNDVHMIISSNWDGLNSGAFALRVHRWTASVLSGILAYPIYEKDRTRTDRFRDQSAFQFLLTHPDSPLSRDPLKHRNHWAQVPMRWFNSLPINNAFYSNGKWLFSHNMTKAMFDNGTTEVFKDGHDGKIQPWKVMRGDLIVHFAGTKDVRDSWMTPWLDRAEALLPEWNNPNHTLALQTEVAEFWRDYEENMLAKLDELKAAAEEAKMKKVAAERKALEEKKKQEERKQIERKKKEEEAAERKAEAARKKEEAAAKKKKAEEEAAAKKKEEEEAAAKKKAEEEAAAEGKQEEGSAETTTESKGDNGDDSTSSSSEATTESSEEKPASDAKNKPASDAEEKPASDAEEKSANHAGEKPAGDAEGKSANDAEEKPAGDAEANKDTPAA